jgi:periplasmic divalent cation tolerance protein
MLHEEGDTLLVYTTMPDRAAALNLARALVSRRLAACVNVLDGCTSVYRWQGAVEEAGEVPVMLKTRSARYAEVEAAIRELHPYELPEIVAVPVVRGFPDYLEWVALETAIPIG